MGVHMQGIMREDAFAKASSRGTAGHGVKRIKVWMLQLVLYV